MAFPPCVKIFCKAGPHFCFTIRDDKVVLALANPTDEYQYWYKYEIPKRKDEEGLPSFALVNKKMGLAIRHAAGPNQPVQLGCYNAKFPDVSILWTQRELGNGYSAIRMLNDIQLHLNASGGYANDGVPLIAHPWNNGCDNEIWKVEQYSPTIKIYCQAGPDFNITIRDGMLVLARSNPDDELQHWYKDESYNYKKDAEGQPAFALINKATGQAIRRESNNSVGFGSLNPRDIDDSMLWTKSGTFEFGYKRIRPFKNPRVGMDACGGHAGDGVTIILYPWGGFGANAVWKTESWNDTESFHETESRNESLQENDILPPVKNRSYITKIRRYVMKTFTRE